MESVTSKTAKTSFWVALERLLHIGVGLVVQLSLARLLFPSDFGTVAMLAVFIGISQAVSECGLTNALIRKQDCSHEDYSTAFLMSLIISLILYLILFIVSPYIADFYHMDLLNDLLRVYALVFIIDSMKIVQYAKLSKVLNFKAITKASALASIISGILAIIMAFAGFGAWALVCQALMSSFINFIILSYEVRWRPVILFNVKSFKYLWGFGSKMLLTGIISRIYSNIYNLVIGRFYNSAILGVFNNGKTYAEFYPYLIDGVFLKNSLPILSEYQDDNIRLCDLYRKFIRLVCFLTFPVCFIVFVLARPIVLFFFTEKWLDAVPYLQIFALSSLLIPANNINLNMLQVVGRTDYTLKAEIIKKTIGFVLVFILLPFGPKYLAVGCGIMSLVAYSVNFFYAKLALGVSLKTQLLDILGIFIASIISSFPVYFVFLFNLPDIVILVIGSVIAGVIYYILTKYIFKLDIYSQIDTVVKSFFSKKNTKTGTKIDKNQV